LKFLITGSSGFLGSNVIAELAHNNQLFTLGRSSSSNIICEFTEGIPDLSKIEDENFDFLLHIAGKAHSIPKTEAEKEEFYNVNVRGTKHLLEALDKYSIGVNTFVFISSVAVYGKEEGLLISEDFPLNGESPYALSKIEAERIVNEWSEKSKVNVVILRLPLIYGENAPGNLGAMEKAIRKGYYFRLGTGSAKRSIVDVKKLAQFFPTLLGKNGVYNISENTHPSYAEIDELLAKKYNKRIRKISPALARIFAKIGDMIPKFPLNTYRLSKLEQSLTFSNEKARKDLGWI
jgi:nucleoside-diphosphate-sugar epimerase